MLYSANFSFKIDGKIRTPRQSQAKAVYDNQGSASKDTKRNIKHRERISFMREINKQTNKNGELGKTLSHPTQ